MNNIDEFKTIIILSGNKRLLHLEADIFANEELTTLYLHTLCKEFSWFSGGESNAALAYWYVYFVTKGRWLEAEPIIATSSYDAYLYAANVIGARWPEGEAVIKSNNDYWVWYCRNWGVSA